MDHLPDTSLTRWQTLQLETLCDYSHTEWDRNTCFWYNKWLLIMKQIEKASEEQVLSLDDSATYLDRNRADLVSINFTTHLKYRNDNDKKIPK